MDNSEVLKKNSILKKFSDTFLNVIDLFCNKYLFLTLLINLSIVTKPVLSAISVTTGMYMYYTAETSAIGCRPSRFFGLLCCLYPDKYMFMTVFKIMYFIALLLISYAVYLVIRRLANSGNKLFVMFCITLFAALLFKSSDREVLSLAFMFAFACFFFSLYFLAFGKERMKCLALAFAAFAVLIDVRTVYLCIIVPLIMLVKNIKTDKFNKVIAALMLAVSFTVFTCSVFLTNDNKNSDEVKQYFEDHYSENYDQEDDYKDEETGTYHMSNSGSTLMPEGFFKVTAIDLVTEWIPNIADTLIGFTFEDIFQGLCYIYIPVIAIYNHLVELNDKRKSVADEV